MKTERLKKYIVIYEVKVEAKNIKEAQELANLEETKHRARLKKIEGENESWERFYDSE